MDFKFFLPAADGSFAKRGLDPVLDFAPDSFLLPVHQIVFDAQPRVGSRPTCPSYSMLESSGP